MYTKVETNLVQFNNTVTGLSSAVFNSVSATALSGTFYGNGSNLTGVSNYNGSDLKALSGNWQSTYSTVSSLSANWNSAYNTSTTYQNASGSFATNTLLQSTSALLTPLTTTNTLTSQLVLNSTLNSLSGNWRSTYSTVSSLSANWNSAYQSTTALNTNFSKLSTQAYSYIPSISGILTGNTNTSTVFSGATGTTSTITGCFNNSIIAACCITPNQGHSNFGYNIGSSILGGCCNTICSIGCDANDSCGDGIGYSCVINSYIYGGTQNQITNTASGYYSNFYSGDNHGSICNMAILAGCSNTIGMCNVGFGINGNSTSAVSNSIVLGGNNNTLCNNNNSSIINGSNNIIGGIGGFYYINNNNTIINGLSSSIGYGNNNLLGVGTCNFASNSFFNNILNGCCNNTSSNFNNILNGCCNTTGGNYNTVSNGYKNIINGGYSNIGSGISNTVNSTYNTITNGVSGCTVGFYSTLLNGYCNSATNQYSLVGNGGCNISSHTNSTILNGQYNTVTYNTITAPTLLIHFDTLNGVSDSSPYNTTVNNFSNSVTLSATAKFGTSSGNFNGSSSLTAGISYTLGLNDYSIDLWFYSNGTTTGYLIGGGNGTVLPCPRILVSNTTLSYRSVANGGDVLSTSFTPNQWNHVALARVSNTTNLYLNGTSVGSTATSPVFTTWSNFRIGAGNAGTTTYYTGLIDEVRVAKGFSYYNGNFTPATQAYTTGNSSIINGNNNTVMGDNSTIIGGSNNSLSANNSFILGSNITAVSSNTTYVNNLSSQGILYGQCLATGSVVAGNTTTQAGCKVQIFSNTGASLGYIQVYSS
jgi:hypothetical protein